MPNPEDMHNLPGYNPFAPFLDALFFGSVSAGISI